MDAQHLFKSFPARPAAAWQSPDPPLFKTRDFSGLALIYG
jgi:hypothetical protein